MWEDVRSGLAWLSDHGPTATGWAAVAAGFSALSAFLTMLIQRRNLLESIRPELVLTHWERRPGGQGNSAHEIIAFSTIKNVGRGVAFHIWLNATKEEGDRHLAGMSTMRVPVLAVGEEVGVNGHITVWLKNVVPKSRLKILGLPVEVRYLDSRGNIYETLYNLTVAELPHTLGSAQIAPGVALLRSTRTMADQAAQIGSQSMVCDAQVVDSSQT